MAKKDDTDKLVTADERLVTHDERDGHIRDGEGYGEHEMTTAERERAAQLTDPERRRQIRAMFESSVLPSIPPDKRFHRCWVSTTHPVDTPERRLRAGYRFVKIDSLRDASWTADKDAVKDGQQADGNVRWRELVLMEIPMDTYVDYMREFHHDMPYEQTQGIFSQLDQLNEEARAKGGRVTLEEGMEDLRRRIQTPPARQFEV